MPLEKAAYYYTERIYATNISEGKTPAIFITPPAVTIAGV
jgi:hypothetical protein